MHLQFFKGNNEYYVVTLEHELMSAPTVMHFAGRVKPIPYVAVVVGYTLSSFKTHLMYSTNSG
jgi:hypothetical protein